MKDIVLFGTGDIAALACRYFEWDSPYRVAAFTADAAYIEAPEFMDRPVVPFEQVAEISRRTASASSWRSATAS
jgi:hypothetical protein